MSAAPPRVRGVVWLLAILGGVLPIVAYWGLLGRVPSVTPDEARDALSVPDSNARLVDVRTPEEFAAGHLEAAQSWPLEEIAAVTAASGVPAELRGRRLLLLCNSGIQSVLAVRHLRRVGVTDAHNVQGGMQAWVASGEKPCSLGLCRLRKSSGESHALPYRESPRWEQGAAVATGFFVKPLYTLLSLVLVVVLWRERSPDLVALRWAMVAFFVGENFCAANYLMHGDSSLLFEFLHSYGMVLCFGLTVFALLDGMDRRLIKLSDPEARCAALPLCHRCIKYAEVPCGLQRTFMLLIPAVMVLCPLPYCADPSAVSYNTRIFGTFYNYSHPTVHQLYETRFLPAAALLLLLASLLVLVAKRSEPVAWSKVLFAAGCGALGFAFFRLILLQVFRDHLVWFSTWEELTELLFIASAGVVLWIFRLGMFSLVDSWREARQREGSARLT
jgi:rhodanese-related sulfurtransferase